MAEFLEIVMVVLFGISWPASVVKAYRARTAKGQSLAFLMLIFVGYLFGIAAKLTASSYKVYVLIFYVLNLLMVGVAIALHFRNRHLDRKKDETQTDIHTFVTK